MDSLKTPEEKSFLQRKKSLLIPLFLSILILALDWVTPPPVLLGIFFVLPVLFAAWYHGLKWGLVFSAVLPGTRFILASDVEHLFTLQFNLINAFDRAILLMLVTILTSRLSDSMARLSSEVRVLEGMLPICSHCKKIRDQNQVWQPLEKYIVDRSDATFTHGLCPDCMLMFYGTEARQ